MFEFTRGFNQKTHGIGKVDGRACASGGAQQLYRDHPAYGCDTLDKKAVYTQVTTTKMSGITVPNNQQEDGYRASGTVNLSTSPMATERALRKGAKELLEQCNCCR